jgi:hypothetical protein
VPTLGAPDPAQSPFRPQACRQGNASTKIKPDRLVQTGAGQIIAGPPVVVLVDLDECPLVPGQSGWMVEVDSPIPIPVVDDLVPGSLVPPNLVLEHTDHNDSSLVSDMDNLAVGSNRYSSCTRSLDNNRMA